MERSNGAADPQSADPPLDASQRDGLCRSKQFEIRRRQMQLCEAVTTFLAGYFSTCKRSAKTQAAYQIDLLQLKTHIGESMPLAGIGPDVLEAWAANLQTNKYAAVSIRRKFATAR